MQLEQEALEEEAETAALIKAVPAGSNAAPGSTAAGSDDADLSTLAGWQAIAAQVDLYSAALALAGLHGRSWQSANMLSSGLHGSLRPSALMLGLLMHAARIWDICRSMSIAC